MAQSRYRVFVSYGHQDKWLAQTASAGLNQVHVDTFLDLKNIQYGDRFIDTILPELERCDELLALLTPSSIERAWLFAEIGVALRSRKRVVGLVYGPSMNELKDRGILSLIGDRKHLFESEDFDVYAAEVARRAELVVA